MALTSFTLYEQDSPGIDNLLNDLERTVVNGAPHGIKAFVENQLAGTKKHNSANPNVSFLSLTRKTILTHFVCSIF